MLGEHADLATLCSPLCSNNEYDSTEQYVPYDGVNGPDYSHAWLLGHPVSVPGLLRGAPRLPSPTEPVPYSPMSRRR